MALLGFGAIALLMVGTSGCARASGSADGRQGARQVEFIVTGTAPNGVEIIYGSDESHLRGSLPLNVTKPIAKNVLYYVSARLKGGGRVVCKVIIGEAVSAGHALGGHNACTAVSPSDLVGGWN